MLYAFKGGKDDGANPAWALTAVKDTLYGTTVRGGNGGGFGNPGGVGTVFKISPSGAESVLHVFGFGSDNSFGPSGPLINVNNVLYGTTDYGGSLGSGMVFALDTSGKERVVHSFGQGGDGQMPDGPLVYANGVLYGVTANGGTHYDGTLFEVSMRGVECVLHSFGASQTDGSNPNGGLLYLNGVVYGTTGRAGVSSITSFGTVYEFSKSGEHVLYHFKGAPDGDGPLGSPIIVNSVLYGTSLYGGAYNSGTVYAFNGWSERVLYSFTGGTDGGQPNGGLIVVNGAGYGTTQYGGAYGYGVIFKISASGSETVLHSFKGGTDGAGPASGLILGDGVLYGTTYSGGGGGACPYVGCGTAFELTL